MATPSNRAIELGAALRKRRKAVGINMTAAAEAAGMSRTTWHRLEQGETGVAWGMLLAAAEVLGLDLRLMAETDVGRRDALVEDALPLQIRLADFPELRKLAWQVGEGVDTLTPHEAHGLYERNARHLDEGAMRPHEMSLLRALRRVFNGSSE